MNRIVLPELLDRLDPSDPDAMASRSDLKKINFLMGNHRWIIDTFQSIAHENISVLELGAGDGSLGKQLLHQFPYIRYKAIDLIPRPDNFPPTANWIKANIFDQELPWNTDVLIVNLMFHHFGKSDLATLGKRIQHSQISSFIINEPVRRKRHLLQFWLACLLGFNHITRHDAPVSIKAGFLNDELPRMLKLSNTDWNIAIQMTFLGAYRMIGKRR